MRGGKEEEESEIVGGCVGLHFKRGSTKIDGFGFKVKYPDDYTFESHRSCTMHKNRHFLREEEMDCVMRAGTDEKVSFFSIPTSGHID